MKRVLVLLLAVLMLLTACGSTDPAPAGETPTPGASENVTPLPTEAPTPEPTAPPADIDPSTVDVITERWVAAELLIVSEKEFDKNEQTSLPLDFVFTNRDTGTVIRRPAFWDKNNDFRVRFAPTECGVWDYVTECPEDPSVSGKTGTVGCNAYKGDLDIYKHGFVRATAGTKYFTYADGTPFFYLGDTHWTMYSEEMNGKGERAGDIDTDSHFKYIVDKRVEQGYTVYQSEPINAPFDLRDGFTSADITGFRKADEYYQYIAEKGLVHTNAEFFFHTDVDKIMSRGDEYIETIARYWVARFGAYPVMWTLAQEVDNYTYADQLWTAEEDPWIKTGEYIHKYDDYAHPLTAHQRGTPLTTASGKGSGVVYRTARPEVYTNVKKAGRSNFYDPAVSERTGHSWWASQWTVGKRRQYVDDFCKDYWETDKVAVHYESWYDHLQATDFGMRVQFWASYLNGFFGFGYGVQDLWYYRATYLSDKDSNEDIDVITVEDKKIMWSEAIELPAGYQMGYGHRILETVKWWKLVPDFNDKQFFEPADDAFYFCAHDEGTTVVLYIYNETTGTGTVKGLAGNAPYTLSWHNPRTGELGTAADVTAAADGTFVLGDKPDTADWVAILTRK